MLSTAGLEILVSAPSNTAVDNICRRLRDLPVLRCGRNEMNIAPDVAELQWRGKPANLVIYATSNRRHLIRESFADREGDEVRVRDSLETVTSLSDRFGLEITFSVPDRDEYLYIVDQLAAESGVDLPGEQLHLLAERFALRRNGRSPRTARQFISQQLAEKYDRKL